MMHLKGPLKLNSMHSLDAEKVRHIVEQKFGGSAQGNEEVLLLKDKSENLVGFLVFEENQIQFLFVRHSHRRMGYGKYMVMQALGIMMDRNHRKAYVQPLNYQSEKFYWNLGFSRDKYGMEFDFYPE